MKPLRFFRLRALWALLTARRYALVTVTYEGNDARAIVRADLNLEGWTSVGIAVAKTIEVASVGESAVQQARDILDGE